MICGRSVKLQGSSQLLVFRTFAESIDFPPLPRQQARSWRDTHRLPRSCNHVGDLVPLPLPIPPPPLQPVPGSCR